MLTPEQSAWRAHALAQYRADAERVIDHVLAGDFDRLLIIRTLELIRTYVAFPGVGEQPLPADEKILHLAQITAWRMRRLGYWREMAHLWPVLCVLAEFTGDAERYVICVKYLANARGHIGDGQAEFVLYGQLINHPYFQNASPTLQANVLMSHATALVWRGRRTLAASLLQKCLIVTHAAEQASLDGTNGLGLNGPGAKQVIEYGNTPPWETRAYALNQLGVLHMFCGEFAVAYQCFAEMSALFAAHAEEKDLACIAQQAIGRLLLYEKKYSAALDLLGKGLTTRQQWEDQEGIAVNLIYIAAAQIGLSQLHSAEAYLADALALCHRLDNQHDLALCHLYLGLLALRRRQPAQAHHHWQTMATIATGVVIHFVEVRPLVPELPTLLSRGQIGLTWHLLRTLRQSTRHDQLSLGALWRFGDR